MGLTALKLNCGKHHNSETKSSSTTQPSVFWQRYTYHWLKSTAIREGSEQIFCLNLARWSTKLTCLYGLSQFFWAYSTMVLNINRNHILTIPNASFVIVSLLHAQLIQCNWILQHLEHIGCSVPSTCDFCRMDLGGITSNLILCLTPLPMAERNTTELLFVFLYHNAAVSWTALLSLSCPLSYNC